MQIVTSLEQIAYELTLLKDQVQTLKKANKALLKHWRAKYTCIQEEGTYTRDTTKVLIAKKEAKRLKQQKMLLEGGNVEARLATQQRCSNYSKTGYNVRTYQEVKEMLDKGSYVESD